MQVGAAEVEPAMSAQQAGRLIGLWRRADGNSVIFSPDSDPHEALHEELDPLPMFPLAEFIDVLPVLPCPGVLKFAKARKKPNAA